MKKFKWEYLFALGVLVGSAWLLYWMQTEWMVQPQLQLQVETRAMTEEDHRQFEEALYQTVHKRKLENEDVTAIQLRQRAELKAWGERHKDKPNSIRHLKAHVEFYCDELPLLLPPVENRGPLVDPADLQPPVVEVPEDAPKPPMAPEPAEPEPEAADAAAPRGEEIEIAGYVRIDAEAMRIFTPAEMTADGKEPENWVLVFSDEQVKQKCVLAVLEKLKAKPSRSPRLVAYGWKGEDDKLGRYMTLHVERYEIAQ